MGVDATSREQHGLLACPANHSKGGAEILSGRWAAGEFDSVEKCPAKRQRRFMQHR
jgi:hypothetical protein